MTTQLIFFFLFVLILAFFFFSLRKSYGAIRSFLISLLRACLLIPLLFSLDPKEKKIEEPIFFKKHSVEVLLDDSSSMKTYTEKIGILIKSLEKKCLSFGCHLEIKRLSTLDPITNKGYTPLASGITKISKKQNKAPLLIFTDAHDYQRNISWSEKLPAEDLPQDIKLVTPKASEEENLWIENIQLPGVGFHTKKIESSLLLKRNPKGTEKQTVQVQALSEGKVLQTKTAYFLKNLNEVTTTILLPPLQKGPHIIEFKVLPSTEESSYEDNKEYRKIEILPNTKGILHLLGTPSWDGRFLRQHLKSEPKYDLVSFYILRDPGDRQEVSEREMSLIPFPAKRLFTEELKNFHLVIMQNFSLTEFLHPLFQKNLVDFVKNGGGLLFLGGDKSLKEDDLKESPLKEIIPFVKETPSFENASEGEVLFNRSLAYSLKLAEPTEEQTNLATLFHDYYEIKTELESKIGLKGLHLTQNSFYQHHHTTPLLKARVAGSEYPLAFASYPGKGRAVWFLSDSLWKLALNPGGKISRNIYNKFIESSLRWLTKEENIKPLKLERIKSELTEEGKIHFEASLEGSTVRYLEREKTSWSLSLCRKSIPREELELKKRGDKKALLNFFLDAEERKETECLLDFKIENPAFGEEKIQRITLLPRMEKDSDTQGSSEKEIQSLAKTLKTEALHFNKKTEQTLIEWLKKVTQETKTPKRTLSRLSEEPYWPLESPLFLLLLLFIPLEIVLRKW